MYVWHEHEKEKISAFTVCKSLIMHDRNAKDLHRKFALSMLHASAIAMITKRIAFYKANSSAGSCLKNFI